MQKQFRRTMETRCGEFHAYFYRGRRYFMEALRRRRTEPPDAAVVPHENGGLRENGHV